MSKIFKFPEGFLWGAATSAHQVEGNNHNDWSEWEKENAERLSKESGGKYPSENYISGKACDHYNRYEEDFNISKSLGHNAHRFSIEWSRIEPEEGKFNQDEIEHYRKVIQALRARNIEPFVTLWHWTNPLWIRDIGGWENPKTIDFFLRYVGKIAQSLDIKSWITINEPSVYAGASYLFGQFSPNVKSWTRSNRVLKNLFEAHCKCYDFLHEYYGNSIIVGLSHNLHYHRPRRRKNFLDWLAVFFVNYIRDTRQIKLAKGKEDFVGLNYYYLDVIQFVFGGGRFGIADVKNPNHWKSDMGWEIFPEGIYHVLKDLKKYNKPIYITENGIADTRDENRVKFIEEHLRWTVKAIQEGVDVRGYFYWSLLDNFEWDKGFWPRFGLVEIDYKTLERKPRLSSMVYAEIAGSNAVEIND
ncbi:MAG: glycoside hydrolase family 1 protein [Parcubacteria group bacterium]|nr:glycoside hydrolase family 1 protein [Parcubacteria group bacterium]